MISLYRVVVVLFCMTLGLMAASVDLGGAVLTLLCLFGVILLLFTLLLFADLCVGVRRLSQGEGNSSDWTILQKLTEGERPLQPGGGILELGGAAARSLGDRKFKADAVKVCKNCKYVDARNRICLKDDLSLEGVTLVAVGCQHWSLGLTVTETADSNQNQTDASNEGATKR